jgi:pilus assembly protein CpaB
MRVQHLLLILAGVLLFGAGVLLAKAMLAAPAPVVAVAAPMEVPTRGVLSAKLVLPSGHFLQPGDFDWTEMPVNLLRPEFVVRGTDNPDQLLSAVLLREIGKGETIQRGDLVSPSERGFLAAVLPPGKRSVSVAVDEVTGSAGLIFPGDRVDVIVTHISTDRDDPGRSVVGETILRDIRVLAVDQAMKGPTEAAPGGGGDAGAPRPVPARTVTLEVSPREAEKLSVGVSLGRLCLALRGLKRDGEKEDKEEGGPVWAGDVLGSLRETPKVPSLPPLPASGEPAPAAPAASKVVVLRGGSSGQ